MALYILLSLVVASRNLVHLDRVLHVALVWAFCLGLISVSQTMFMQREHIIAAGLIVYVSSTIKKDEHRKIDIIWQGIAALLIAISFALKPQYLLVLVLVEAVVMVYHRTLLPRKLVLALVVLGGVYLTAIIVFQTEYFEFILPLARDYYAGYFSSWQFLMSIVVAVLLCLVIPIRLLWVGGLYRKLVVVLCVTTLGCLLAFLIGRTGFGYHLIPTSVMFVTINVLAFVVGFKRFWLYRRLSTALCLVSIVLVLGVLTKLDYFRNYEVSYALSWQRLVGNLPKIEETTLVESPKITALANSIEPYVCEGESILFLAQRMYPHTLAAHSGMVWASRLPNFWLLPVALENKGDARANSVLDLVRNTLSEDIRNKEPIVIVIEHFDSTNTYISNFDFLSFFLDASLFKQELQRYHLADTLMIDNANFSIFVRKKHLCLSH
ncbi:hypothetical protein JCM19239_435 [Vibrio variabilis]|uniref:Uncharacterized protein n=1 Tax=Vibrio variabilis TaxID=990271 RepID=A0ABQ0JJA3_9VIBR|nr:hypothetical protein JCM19239_435 [Vibrio variabilis]